MAKYSVGVDFGSLSARAVVIDVDTGFQAGTAVMDYPHGVMTRTLPTGEKLPDGYALQHPQDYLDCLSRIIRDAMKSAGITADEVISMGLDFTACTVLPVDSDYRPLCFDEKYKHEKHAYVKLWKHHGAQALSETITEKGQRYLGDLGGASSAEWMFPKLWETYREARGLYDDTYSFIEAGDWVVRRMTGNATRGLTAAAIKAMWNEERGYPDAEFLDSLETGFSSVLEKLPENVLHLGSRAGNINSEGSDLTGLNIGTPVAVFNTDAHVSYVSMGRIIPGTMLMIIGTSTCHILASEKYTKVEGICGVVKDSLIDGLYGYEAGQSGVGDCFDWMVKNCVNAEYVDEARSRGISMHELLTEKAKTLKPGQSGLIALDWLNGNRSVLADFTLSGLLLGLTLETRPEEIYRSLIEATAFGTRRIMETFEKAGVSIERLVACGGISKKNSLLMQIYADILQKEIYTVKTDQSAALGSAVYGTVAAGYYKDIYEAAARMGGLDDIPYRPNIAHTEVYDKLYSEYVALEELFGRGGNNVMKRLRKLRSIK